MRKEEGEAVKAVTAARSAESWGTGGKRRGGTDMLWTKAGRVMAMFGLHGEYL